MLPRTRQKADMAWSVNSPGLVTQPSHTQPLHAGRLVTQQESSVLSVIWPDDHWFASQAVSEGIVDYPQPRHPHHFRLGRHFEQLLFCWLRESTALSLIQSNQQVFDHKRTVGEFDLLVACQGQIEHWEVAIKFYLGLNDTSHLHHWHGPNTADRFDLKYHRLVNHQLSLSRNKFGRLALEKLGLQVNRVRAIIKGRLFYPWAQFITNQFDTPEIINPHHEKGWWIDESEIPQHTFKRIVYLEKQHWLSPITYKDRLPIMNYDELGQFLNLPDIEPATHVALLDETGEELSRGFVVKPLWRELASRNQ